MSVQPWHELSPEVAAVLRPALSEVADDIIAAVGSVPGYTRPIEGDFGRGVRAGVEVALRHFLDEVEAQGRVPRLDVYVELGRGEVRAGRTLDALLGAYRIGARVAWRKLAAIGVAHGLDPDTLYLLAESLFAYIDELSAESAAGYALEQSVAAGEAELRRRRVVRLLVREPGIDRSTVEAAAAEADWPLPRSLAVLATDGLRREAPFAKLPVGTIADVVSGLGCAVVPDPDGPGRRAQIERALAEAGVTGGLGPTVEWERAARSFARARAALALGVPAGTGAGAGAGGALIVARDRVGELLLCSDPELAAELAADRLAPLAELPAGSRARLSETLAAWLAEQGRLGPAAERLGVHAQTVRYRLGRLRDLMGDALDDPDERFWLDLALRIEATAGPGD